MATWLPGIPPDTIRIELTRVTLGGPLSAVVGAVYTVIRSDGPPVVVEVPRHSPVLYEVLVADLRALNRALSRR